jgi:adenylate kinase family enzyme
MSTETPMLVGRRIAVWGATGSGKTTFAERLGHTLGLSVVDLDAIRHANGWDSTDWDEFREVLTRRLEGHPEGWITAGSYSAISDVYLSRIDTLVWLHLPWRTSFWRLFWRSVSRAVTREPLYHEQGPRESWRLLFTSRRSILWWSISHHGVHVRNTLERIAALPPSVRVHELRSPQDVMLFLEAVQSSERSRPRSDHSDALPTKAYQ